MITLFLRWNLTAFLQHLRKASPELNSASNSNVASLFEFVGGNDPFVFIELDTDEAKLIACQLYLALARVPNLLSAHTLDRWTDSNGVVVPSNTDIWSYLSEITLLVNHHLLNSMFDKRCFPASICEIPIIGKTHPDGFCGMVRDLLHQWNLWVEPHERHLFAIRLIAKDFSTTPSSDILQTDLPLYRWFEMLFGSVQKTWNTAKVPFPLESIVS